MQEDFDQDDAERISANEVIEGLVAVGGVVTPDSLLRAYRTGVFPWSSDPVLTWWSPDPRAIFDLERYRPSKSLRKRIRREGWTFTVDRDFEGVMRRCAEATPSRPTTWITGDFIAAYTELHRRGAAHSVEVYARDDLVGGLYGVSLGGFFGGESMFHLSPDASKAALAYLVQHLRERGFGLLDAQVPTPHLTRLGAVEISRGEYLARLRHAMALQVTF
jgi:leucyl/phenylalanyl-tRNA--protein transferase